MRTKWFGRGPSGLDVEIEFETLDTATAKVIDGQLKELGFTAGDRFAAPVRYGGAGPGKRPPLQPPPGLIVPEHCGVPAKYIVYAKSSAKGHEGRGVKPGFADMWVCSRDKQCSDVKKDGDRAWASFDMKSVPAQKASATNGAVNDAPGAQALEPVDPNVMTTETWRDFWSKVRGMGFSRETVFVVAGQELFDDGHKMPEAEFKKCGRRAVHVVYEALKKAKEVGSATPPSD